MSGFGVGVRSSLNRIDTKGTKHTKDTKIPEHRKDTAAVGHTFEPVSKEIIGAALEVHRSLGPGLLEATYEICTAHELQRRGFAVERQKVMPIRYNAIRLECGYRVDLLVENAVIVELKSVEKLTTLHTAQLLTYLKLSGFSLGLLINFNVPVLRDGIRRVKL